MPAPVNFPLKVTGDDVARTFGAIANAAEAAQAKITASNRRSEIALKASSAAMKDIRIAAEGFATSLGPAGSALAALAPTGVAGAAALGVTAVGAALTAAAIKATQTASALKDSADRVGLNVEVLQEYQFAARQA